MQFAVVTLFPDMLRSMFTEGVTGRAVEAGAARLATCDPREHVSDPHRTVDDRPFGGGPGMVLRYAPLKAAITQARGLLPAGSPMLLLSPQGERLNDRRARALAQAPGVGLVCGRYEGVDQRVIDELVDGELSIGDYVLSGGELAAAVVIDAVVRLLPGTLGAEASAEQDSFVDARLDCPHYTRPDVVDGKAVPPVLLSGDHAAIRRWRAQQALARTWRQRPDLLAQRPLSDDERRLLEEYVAESAALPARD